jgi:nicotinate phosphoribosyltransferase
MQRALFTDLYELTMAAAYFENGLDATASFELFARSLPANRGYLLAAGLEQALEYLESLRFSDSQVDWLRKQPVFANVSRDFFDFLSGLRFTGEVWAVPEGVPVFANEPLLRVTAPIIEAQIVETYLLSTIGFQTLVATKAARCVDAARGRAVLEFGSRRAHGPEAGLFAARAAYIGGCAGSSNVEASYRFGIPTFGTLAHSFIMSYDDEAQSFRDFSRVFPSANVLLLDTYDTLRALDKAIAAGLRPTGVRLDSGDLAALAKQVRRCLDDAGLRSTKIVGSSDLDEWKITELLDSRAPIDHFGVGTALATSKDAPALSCVYKLVEYAGKPRSKISEEAEKFTYPGCKQVFRLSQNEIYSRDLIGLADEDCAGAEPLLIPVMRNGRRTGPQRKLLDIQIGAQENLRRLPAAVRRLTNPATYPVDTSPALRNLLEQVQKSRQRKSPRAQPLFSERKLG